MTGFWVIWRASPSIHFFILPFFHFLDHHAQAVLKAYALAQRGYSELNCWYCFSKSLLCIGINGSFAAWSFTVNLTAFKPFHTVPAITLSVVSNFCVGGSHSLLQGKVTSFSFAFCPVGLCPVWDETSLGFHLPFWPVRSLPGSFWAQEICSGQFRSSLVWTKAVILCFKTSRRAP